MSRQEERAAWIGDITASKAAWDVKTAEAGHAMTWRLDDRGPDYSPTWYGTCGNCGATMSVFPGGTSTGESAGRCARDIPCPGPGTAWQNDMVRDLAVERTASAVSRFGQAVKDNADSAWLASQGLDDGGPAAEPTAAWKELAAQTGEFDPEDDADLLAWMSGEAAGMTGYAEAVAAAYDTAVHAIGLDPAALPAMHECADAVAEAAQQMAAAREAFTAHYAEVRTFAAGGGVLPFNGRWMTGEDSAGRTTAAGQETPVPSGKAAAPLPAVVTVALADGEARTAAVSTADGGSYACPWCGSPVCSPQAWEEGQRAGAALAERFGEPAPSPRPYPDDQAAAWNARGCANPGCWAGMTAGQLAAARERAGAEAERRSEGERLRQWSQEQADRRRSQEEELWERLAAEAAEHGSCLRCLYDSAWRFGRPRMVRHRSPDYHDTH